MFSTHQALLVVIDIQGKLASLIHDHMTIYQNIKKIIQIAKILDIPIIGTEQVPQKLGSTIPEIYEELSDKTMIQKVSFSCCENDQFIELVKSFQRKQIILVGIEAHVCVYQTAADFMNLNFDVSVICDGVGSRTVDNKNIALERMKTLGAAIVSSEMMICELLRTAQHPQFRNVMKFIK